MQNRIDNESRPIEGVIDMQIPAVAQGVSQPSRYAVPRQRRITECKRMRTIHSYDILRHIHTPYPYGLNTNTCLNTSLHLARAHAREGRLFRDWWASRICCCNRAHWRGFRARTIQEGKPLVLGARNGREGSNPADFEPQHSMQNEVLRSSFKNGFFGKNSIPVLDRNGYQFYFLKQGGYARIDGSRHKTGGFD